MIRGDRLKNHAAIGGCFLHGAFAEVTRFFRFQLMLVLALLVAGCSTSEVLRPTAAVAPLPNEKYAAIVVNADSGRVLYEYESDAPRYPASLTKMMTVYLMFEALDSGRMRLDTPIPVSAYAASRPPTKIGFKPGQSIDARSAILALCVKSANDVATAVAEHLGGTEANFARMMTAEARRLGMRSTTFRNASGLPDPGQVTTARDMATLAVALRERFPHHYHYFSNRSFTYAGKRIEGHNDLLGTVPGVDGLKTGYIRASGFNLATSILRGGRRYVAVVMGGKTGAKRNAHMIELIEAYVPDPSRSIFSGSFAYR